MIADILGLDIANWARIGVIFFGGVTVGAGSATLCSRARFYGSIGFSELQRAMHVLVALNVIILTYITMILLFDRWDAPLNWHWAMAVAIYILKAWFFRSIRNGMALQEAQLRDAGLRGVGRNNS